MHLRTEISKIKQNVDDQLEFTGIIKSFMEKVSKFVANVTTISNDFDKSIWHRPMDIVVFEKGKVVHRLSDNGDQKPEVFLDNVANWYSNLGKPKQAIKKAAPQSSKTTVKPLSDANFSGEVMKSTKPFIVFFSTGWCPNCKDITPFFNKLAGENSDVAQFGKIECESEKRKSDPQKTCEDSRFGIEGYPDFILIEGGKNTSFNWNNGKNDPKVWLTRNVQTLRARQNRH